MDIGFAFLRAYLEATPKHYKPLRKYYNSKAEYRSLLVQTKDLQEERDGYWAIVSAITQKKDIQSAVLSAMTYNASNYGYDAAKYRLGAIESQVKDLAVKKLLTEKQNVESMKSPEESTEIDLSGAVEQLFGDMPTTTPIKPSPLEEEKK